MAALAAAVVVMGLTVSGSAEVQSGAVGHGVPRIGAVRRQATGAGLAGLPVGLQASASSALGAASGRFAVVRSGRGRWSASGGGVSTSFGSGGPVVRADRGVLRLRVSGVGYEGRLSRLGSSAPVAARNRVVYRRAGVSEWYRNGPLGLEQGFTVRDQPRSAGRGWLTISERLSGDLVARRAGKALVLVSAHGGQELLRYRGLSAIDARGRSLAVRLRLRGSTVLLEVNDAGARYPVTVDPMFQQAELTPDDEVGRAEFGSSVALSADGNTALIGGPNDRSDVGAAWVFTRSGATWTQQGAKLTAEGASGRPEFGSSVALSGDGDTALIGGPDNKDTEGAAWVFTRSGTSWTQQDRLTADDESVSSASGGCSAACSEFGSSVALSADGNTALIGGPNDDYSSAGSNIGAAWIFSRSGSAWTQDAKLTGNESDGLQPNRFGSSVALSADGSTALIGDPDDDHGHSSAAWVFTGSDSSWTQQGPALKGQGDNPQPGGGDNFGWSVALSADGNTALIGAPTAEYDNASFSWEGAAVVFVRSGSTWTQQTVLTAPAYDEYTAESVALSTDGNTALISAEASALMFTRSDASWTQQPGTGGGDGVVALSGDGNTSLAGGGDTAAVYVFGLALTGPYGSTNSRLPDFTGLAGTRPGDASSVTVDLYAGSAASGTPIQTLNAPVQSDGSFSVPASSSLPDGTYTARAQQAYSGGTVVSASDTFTVDTVAPTVSLTNPPDGGLTSTQPVFSGTASTQPGDSLAVLVDVYSGSTAEGTPTKELTAGVAPDGSYSVQSSLAGGTYTVKAHYSDDAGNVGFSSAHTFTVDTTPPASFRNLAPANGSLSTNTRPTFRWTASSDPVGLRGYRVLLDGSQIGPDLPATTTSYTPSSILPDGGYFWRVAAIDNFGNVTYSTTWKFKVKTRPPTAAITADNTSVVTGTVVNFSAAGSTDPEGGRASITDYAWDPEGAGTFTSTGKTRTFQHTYTRAGTYTATVRVTNDVGLSSTASVAIVVHPAPPPGPIGVSIDDAALYTNDPHVTLNAVWPAGVDTMTVSNDGGFANAQTFPVAASVPWTLDSTSSELQAKTVYVRFGSSTQTFTDDITLDTVAPVIQAASEAPAAASGGFDVSVTASDDNSGLANMQITTSTASPGPILPFTPNTTYSGAVAPQWVRVQDRAGNFSPWHAIAAPTPPTIVAPPAPPVPLASGLSVSPRTFALTGRRVKGRCVVASRTNRKDHTCRRQIALRVRYKLTIPARVSFRIKRLVPGRVVKGRCVQPTRKNRRQRRCTRLLAVGRSFTRTGVKGTNTFLFNGKVEGRKLRSGIYRLTAVPGINGRDGKPVSTSFQFRS